MLGSVQETEIPMPVIKTSLFFLSSSRILEIINPGLAYCSGQETKIFLPYKTFTFPRLPCGPRCLLELQPLCLPSIQEEKERKKAVMAFPLEATFWNLHISLLLTPQRSELSYTAQPSCLKNLRNMFYFVW